MSVGVTMLVISENWIIMQEIKFSIDGFAEASTKAALSVLDGIKKRSRNKTFFSFFFSSIDPTIKSLLILRYFFIMQTSKALSVSCLQADFLLIKPRSRNKKKVAFTGDVFLLNQQHENTLRARQRLIKFYERYKNVKRKYILCLFNTLL